MNKDMKNFVLELEQLSRKYSLKIGGCGCCGSPFIDKMEKKELGEESGYILERGGDLKWISPAEKYSWKEQKDKIIK